MYLALYHLIQALLVLVSEFVLTHAFHVNDIYIYNLPTLGFQFTFSLVFLHHEQVFRLLLKISVEENNGMSLWTNFSSPCLEAGLTK